MAHGEEAKLVYAVFGSPLAGLSTSAICAFDLAHITRIFSNSSFRHVDYNRHPTWLREDAASKYRPGNRLFLGFLLLYKLENQIIRVLKDFLLLRRCVQDISVLSNRRNNFITKNSVSNE